MTERIAVGSICTGIGGMELGLDPKKFKVAYHCENDKHCNAILSYLHPEIRNYGNIKEQKLSELPDTDIIIGGTPCSDFSITKGKLRRGLNGAKSGLFYYFIKAIEEKRPRYFVWENVKGTLNSQKGWDLAAIQVEMADAGYDTRWEVLNGRDYGVPQVRERIFIVGVRRGDSRQKTFLQERVCFEDVKRVRFSEVPNDSIGKKHLLAYSSSTRVAHLDHRMRVNDSANTLTTGNGCRTRSSSNYIAWKTEDNDYKIRHLSVNECEFLMGWERGRTRFGLYDGEKKEVPVSVRYKICGNGVISSCAAIVIESLMQCNETIEETKNESINSDPA